MITLVIEWLIETEPSGRTRVTEQWSEADQWLSMFDTREAADAWIVERKKTIRHLVRPTEET